MKSFAFAFFTFLLGTPTFANTMDSNFASVKNQLLEIEKTSHVRIGVYTIDNNSHQSISYHANLLFPFQSTFKIIGVANLLQHSSLLDKKILYTKKDLIFWHPVTGKYINKGMTLRSLAKATTIYSDNPAINLIMNNLRGPKGVNAFAHNIGNKSFNLKHYEPNLNSDPTQMDDSSTPKDMALSLNKILFGNVLRKPERTTLLKWMRDSTTGYSRIRAGVPIGWAVADKTGSGSFGIANV